MREIFWGLGDKSLIMVALVSRILGADLVITVDERSDRSVKSLLIPRVFLGSSLWEAFIVRGLLKRFWTSVDLLLLSR